MHFFYSFTETILHSLWQSALLLLLSFFLSVAFKSLHPLYKRNLFYGTIGLQIIISICTFLYCFSNYSLIQLIVANNVLVLNNQQQLWLQNNAAFIFSIYLVVVFVRLFSIWLQWNKFKIFYTKALIKPSAELKIFTQVKALHVGVKRNIRIWYSENIETPVTFGFLKPIILLPFSLVNNITNEEAESIILHELAHVKNNDYLLNWLLIFIDTLYFFNPFIKIIIGKIKYEREKNCDIQVIHFGYDPLLYAQTLLKIAKNNNSYSSFQLAAAKNTNQLLYRIKFFTNEKKLNFKRVSPMYISFIFLVSIAICLLPFTKKKFVNIATSAFTNANNTYVKNTAENYITYESSNINGEKKKGFLTSETRLAKPNKTTTKQIDVDENLNEEPATVAENIFSTVAYNETADSIKEVTINLETQQGKITQVYKLSLTDGKWIVQPQWMLIEKNADSNSVKMRDSLYNKIDTIQ